MGTGISASGNYILNDQTVAFCDMSKQISDPDIQRLVGRLSYDLSSPLMFIAVREESGSSDYYIPTGQISFNIEQVDHGSNFNAVDGSFTAPSNGLYYFYDNENNFEQITFFYTLELEKNDKVWLVNLNSDSFYVPKDHPMTYLGFFV